MLRQDPGSWFLWVVLVFIFLFFAEACYIHPYGNQEAFFLMKEIELLKEAHVGCGGFLRAWGFAINPRESAKGLPHNSVCHFRSLQLLFTDNLGISSVSLS